MEVQFNRTSAGGSILTGPITILGMTVGLLLSGYSITKYKPGPKYLFFWNVILGIMSMCTQIFYTQIGCDGSNSLLVNDSVVSCNVNCNCDGISYSPVCDRLTNTTYFSPCHAGCRTFDEQAKIYRDCTCTNSIKSEIEIFQSPIDRKISKRSTSTASFLVPEMVPTEKRLTFYDIYDEELQPNNPPHDDDETIDANDLYDGYDDSQHDLDALPTRKRRQLHENHSLVPQACIGDCNWDYYAFSLVSMISSLISSTGRIGNVLLNFR